MRLTFVGGAREVTGANYLLESGDLRVLIDFGLAQGSRYNESKNYEPLSYDVKSIDSVFVTHSHIDHIGRLPQLAKLGYITYGQCADKFNPDSILIDNSISRNFFY